MALYKRSETVRDFNGVVVSKVSVKVVTGDPYSETSPLASLFQDAAGLIPLANPLTADAAGQYSYWAAGGTYSEKISRPGYYSVTNDGFLVGGEKGDTGPMGNPGTPGPPGLDVRPLLSDGTDPANGSGMVAHNESLMYPAGSIGKALQNRLFTTDLAETMDPTTGANMVGFNAALAYAASTVGSALAALTTFAANIVSSSGSTFLGYLAPFAGAVARTQAAKNAEQVSAFDFMTTAQIADVQAGTLLIDCRSALQAAIDAAIAAQKRLFLPMGNYSISGPLRVWQWTGTAFTFTSLCIEGEALSYNANSTGLKATTITPTFNDTAAIFVQAARAFTLKNVFLKGQNVPNLSSPWAGLLVNANYVQGGARDSRYSPYAGVAIDPFGTSVPADGGYSGFSSYYVATNSGSSRVLFQDVTIENFVTAVILSPNGNTQNAENVDFINCHLSLNKIAIAVCQSQSRSVNWFGGSAGFNLFFADGKLYGAQTGVPPCVFGLNASGKYLFNFSSGQGGNRIFSGIYTENLGGIGFLGAGATTTNDAVVFDGCVFKFSEFSGVAADFHLVAFCPVAFVGCLIQNANNDLPIRFYRHVQFSSFSFTSCNFMMKGSEFIFAPTTGTANQDWDGLSFDACLISLPSGGVSALFSHNMQRYQNTNLNRQFVPLGAFVKFSTGGNGILNYVNPTQALLAVGVGVTVTVAAGTPATATFNPTDAALVRVGDNVVCSSSFNFEGPSLGVLASSWTAIGTVTANNGTTVTIAGLPQSFVTGSYNLYTTRIPRYHPATTCTLNSTTAISAMTNPTAWAAGDPIYGTGIPAGAYLVSTDGAGNAVLSKAATATNTNVRVYDANVYSFTGTAV